MLFLQFCRLRWVRNPLSANVEDTPREAVATSDSCNCGHSENYEKELTFSCKSLKFPTKWYTKLNFVIWFIHSWEIASEIFNIKKKRPKRALANAIFKITLSGKIFFKRNYFRRFSPTKIIPYIFYGNRINMIEFWDKYFIQISYPIPVYLIFLVFFKIGS